ncbi:hypothetical protein BKA62DRAFT_698772 [Auriculariales sp. MPI-PUGE-AT-0066]|nr:hypothetical protein BKA62DRAFT_698772 [Auriculariales sp. MPI-PUGE-AT-0066]
MLGPRLQHALVETTTEVFRQHLDTDRFLRSNAEALQNVATAIAETVRTALSSALRELNKENMLYSKLPNELWCRTWEHLTTDECLTVTHVCQDWRRTACAWPRLWTQLIFLLDYAYRDEETVITSTHLDRMALYVERCAHVPFDIEIQVDGDGDADEHGEDELREFGLFIARHSTHIRSLDITSERMACIQEFINQLSELPLLKTFAINSPYGYGHELKLDLNLPSLEVLHLDGYELEPSASGFNLSAPSLRTLFARVQKAQDIILLLQCAPPSQELSLTFSSSFEISKRDSAEIQKLLPPGLKIIQLDEIWLSREELIVPTFYRADIPTFSMQHRLMETTTDPTVPSVLRDVLAPIELICRAQHMDDEFVLSGPTMERIIRVSRLEADQQRDPAAFPRNLWEFLAPNTTTSLVKLTVFARLLTDMLPPLSGNSVRELIINVGGEPDGEDMLKKWLEDNKEPAEVLFPMLEQLTLDNDWGWSQRQMKHSMSSLAEKLAAALSVPGNRPLRQLFIRSLVFAEDGVEREVAWKVLADEVSYYYGIGPVIDTN